MSDRGHAAEDGSFGRSATGAMARGIALIVAAVVLGVVLLNATDGPEPFAAAAGSDESEATEDEAVPEDEEAGAEDDEGDGTTTTTSTTVAARAPGEVTVLVANGSGVPGAAGRLTATIQGGGYLVTEPANAAPVPSSSVYFTEGFQAEAAAVAALLTPAPPVAALPDPSPVVGGNLRGAQVVVVQGPELAGEG